MPLVLFKHVKAVHLTFAIVKKTLLFDTSFQRCIHNLLFEPFLCSVNTLDCRAQRQESDSVAQALWLLCFARGFFHLMPDLCIADYALLAGQLWIVMNSNRVAICAQEWPCTHACDKDINVLPCLFFRGPGLFIRSILRSTIMTFSHGHSRISWVTQAVICYYIE